MYDEDKLTLEDVRTLGGDGLWRWLYMNPVTDGRLSKKADWPEFDGIKYCSKVIWGQCFCCQYTEDRCASCDVCPTGWEQTCKEPNGAFERWDKSEDPQQRAVWAYQMYLLHMAIDTGEEPRGVAAEIMQQLRRCRADGFEPTQIVLGYNKYFELCMYAEDADANSRVYDLYTWHGMALVYTKDPDELTVC